MAGRKLDTSKSLTVVIRCLIHDGSDKRPLGDLSVLRSRGQVVSESVATLTGQGAGNLITNEPHLCIKQMSRFGDLNDFGAKGELHEKWAPPRSGAWCSRLSVGRR